MCTLCRVCVNVHRYPRGPGRTYAHYDITIFQLESLYDTRGSAIRRYITGLFLFFFLFVLGRFIFAIAREMCVKRGIFFYPFSVFSQRDFCPTRRNSITLCSMQYFVCLFVFFFKQNSAGGCYVTASKNSFLIYSLSLSLFFLCYPLSIKKVVAAAAGQWDWSMEARWRRRQ